MSEWLMQPLEFARVIWLAGTVGVFVLGSMFGEHMERRR